MPTPNPIGGDSPPQTSGRKLGFISSSSQAYGYDPNNISLSKPYGKDMFQTGGKNSNLGVGISSLAGFSEENRKSVGESGYQQDFAAVYEYNQLMK